VSLNTFFVFVKIPTFREIRKKNENLVARSGFLYDITDHDRFLPTAAVNSKDIDIDTSGVSQWLAYGTGNPLALYSVIYNGKFYS
jgi:hypothetical protein